ncbi:PREDICTED: RNA-binding protein 44 [Chrysochloris asiatica]|uniref:RNA-binding protein 44 n=1 Tax=Chrysochloris asiatica TaxID=185453 RepID=A0A9B0WTX9_CHRAS|nr:PREDICTED: RNA-binding protein 44 [Chrysochloris asiatica]
MEPSAVVGTAPGKSCYRSGGILQKGEVPANLESTHSNLSEFEDSMDCALLNETYSVHYSDAIQNHESHIDLSSELQPDMQTREEVLFNILEHQGPKTSGVERHYQTADPDCEETVAGVLTSSADEDSLQEYHSAEEPELIRNHPSCDQTKTVDIAHLEVVGFGNSGCEANSLEDDNHIKLGSSSVFSLESLDVYGQDVSKFQSSVMLRKSHEQKYEKYKEQEASLTYHTVFDESIQSSTLEKQESQSESDFLNPPKALEANTHTGKMKSQVTESKDFYENFVEKSKFQHFHNPSAVLQQEKALETLLQPCQNCQSSWNAVFDDSIISAYGSSHYSMLQRASDPTLDCLATLPRIVVEDKQAMEDSSLSVADSHITNRTSSPNMEGTCDGSVMDAARCTMTVNQSVDVSTDFRACFTISRATSARPSVVSTSSNTEITMMNKTRPSQWQNEKLRSVACNTDWSYRQDCVDTQTAVMRGPGKPVSVDSFKPSGHVLNKDSLELRKTPEITDLKKHPERGCRLSKELEKSWPSKCCQEIMQRALRAEMYLLNAHYQMCHYHCCDIYKLLLENKEGEHRNLPSNSAKKELGTVLLSVLGDIKARYVSLKEKISKGIPLDELPPFSVESKLLSTLSAFTSKLIKEEIHVFTGADSGLERQSEQDDGDSSSLKRALSQVSSPDNCHPGQDVSPEEDGCDNGGMHEDFRQLRLEDADSRSCLEISEDWFDAKENLTGGEVSGILENQLEQDRCSPKCTPEMKSAEPLRRDEGYLVHVGGLCSLVSEADLRTLFQKYQVSEIAISDSSNNHRYASVSFKKSIDATTAVKEMNGVEIHGRKVNVRLVKPGEAASPPPSTDGLQLHLNDVEKSSNKEANLASCVSRLPRTRARQLGSEAHSEFSPFNQKGVQKNCKETKSTGLLPRRSDHFTPPNTLNLRSFTKILKRLTELHPEVSRDHIIEALQEVRLSCKGFLNGLSINTIVEKTSSVLKNSTSI